VPSDEDQRPYAEVRDSAATQAAMDQYLVDFNAVSRKPMDLVMFMFAIEHVSRISRILQMPGGNALLVGVGGSGRQSVSILATEIAGYVLKRIEISKNYGQTEWRDDLKLILREAGSGDKPVVFLFSDTQIKSEAYVEDINNMLNSGEVPNIFANDEKVAICEAVRPFAKAKFGQRDAGTMTPLQLYNYFLQRVRTRLHIILAFSPIGDAFRDRLRLFPSLVNCCAIDWCVPAVMPRRDLVYPPGRTSVSQVHRVARRRSRGGGGQVPGRGGAGRGCKAGDCGGVPVFSSHDRRSLRQVPVESGPHQLRHADFVLGADPRL
jgi:dynein heavy chain